MLFWFGGLLFGFSLPRSVLAGRLGKPLWTKEEWAAWVQQDLDLPIFQAQRV